MERVYIAFDVDNQLFEYIAAHASWVEEPLGHYIEYLLFDAFYRLVQHEENGSLLAALDEIWGNIHSFHEGHAQPERTLAGPIIIK